MKEKIYTIEELSEMTGYSRRTIRYYVHEGLLEPPAGRGRGGFYNDSHVNRLVEIRSLQEKGVKLAAIQGLLGEKDRWGAPPAREVWVKYPVAPGVEIHIQREIEEKGGRRITEIIRVIRAMLKGEEDE
jgi:DNA-binding transcriptional MerR regulator